jgi:hypothetical protein
MFIMSKLNKKETTFISTTSNSNHKDNFNQDNNQDNNQQIDHHHLSSRTADNSKQSLNQVLDETKRNIEKNTDEARLQIPRYTQTVSELQEQVIQTSKDIAEHYLEYQREVIDSVQSIFAPYVENTNNNLLNNQEYFRKIPEIYSKITSNFAQNTIDVNRMFNDLIFANVDAFKTVVNNAKEHSKHLTEIGKRNAKICEEMGQNNRNTTSTSI